MTDREQRLASLGWNASFEAYAKVRCQPGETAARVAAVDREQFLLLDENGAFPGKLSGGYRYAHQLAEEYPCVGDWVSVEKHPDFGVVQSLFERKTSLRRKAVGRALDYQMIGANIDAVMVVQSCHFDFNLKRLERYLVMVADGGAEPNILLTKTDLVSAEELASQLTQIRDAGIKAPVLTLSNVTREGVDVLKRQLLPGRTYCFVGSSGVGKSTLINELVGRGVVETGDVSGTGEGRHTTVRRELLVLPSGALVIDNPGMREFGVMGDESALSSGFGDIGEFASRCRFGDCTHTNEPGCAVLEALENGEIDREHYDHFLKLRKETAFHQMSYVERRKKDRAFGKFAKSVLKHKERE
ncbi:MAG: ribosome small subunit-dependent GTPase A [Nibricoccus sp.]